MNALLHVLTFVFCLSVAVAPAFCQTAVHGNQDLRLSTSQTEEFEQMALAGDGQAAHKLYQHYALTQQNHEIGEYWLTVSAENGFLIGQYKLAIILSKSESQRDQKRAVFWVRKAVEGGYQPAQKFLDELSLKPVK